MGRISLTGATGFIGWNLLNALVEKGYTVKALYRPGSCPRPPELPGVEWIAGSLEDAGSLRGLVKGARAVVHCAGSVRGNSPEHFFKTNAIGTRLLAESAVEAGVSRFILISSLAARHPRLSPYAASKKEAERMISDSALGLEWTILRPPAVYGPGDREIAPLFAAMEKGVLPVPAQRGNRFSLIHVHDLSEAVSELCSEGVPGDAIGAVFELHDGRNGGYSWETVAETFRRVRGRRVVLLPVPKALVWMIGHVNLVASRMLSRHPMLSPWKVREIFHPDWTCDNRAICRALGWRPSISLKIALENGLIGK